jgi:hypothetical protein
LEFGKFQQKKNETNRDESKARNEEEKKKKKTKPATLEHLNPICNTQSILLSPSDNTQNIMFV